MLSKLINFFKSLFKRKEKPQVVDTRIPIENIEVHSKGKQVSLKINGVNIPAKVTYEHSEEGELFGYFSNGPGCYVVTLEENPFGLVDASIWTSRKEEGNYIGVSLWLETFGPGVDVGYLTYEAKGTSKLVRHNKRSIKFEGDLIAKYSRIVAKDTILKPFKDGDHSVPVKFNLTW